VAVDQSAWLLKRVGFSIVQLYLAKAGGLRGIQSRFQAGLFEEIPPARVMIRRALGDRQFFECCFRVLPAFDDLNHTCGLVGADVVADNDVRSAGFFACQRDSVRRIPRVILAPSTLNALGDSRESQQRKRRRLPGSRDSAAGGRLPGMSAASLLFDQAISPIF
jgi:hypothetical protein